MPLEAGKRLRGLAARVRRRPWAWGVGAGLLALVTWRLADLPRSLAIEIRDQIGLGLVEGHAERITLAARESRVDPLLIAAVMYVESHGRGGQTSSAGALGLMQLVPGAAVDAARRLKLSDPDPDQVRTDDDLNVRLGAAHLAWLLANRGEWDLEQVLVSYNAGRVRLLRWIERHGGYAAWRAAELAAERSGEGATGALRYALEVLEARRVLARRGAIPPVEGVAAVE